MDKRVMEVLQDYEQRSREESRRAKDIGWDEFVAHRDEFLLAVGPATGQLLNVLVKETKAKTILEVGTSYGYSTIWLADAARANDGKVITLDLLPYKQDHARSQLTQAGLEGYVDFRLGDARETIRRLKKPLDFVLLDLWKDLYIECFDLFYPDLSPGALVVADNMVYPESANERARAYRSHVRGKPDMQSMLLPVGSGLEVSRCIRGDGTPV
jgi:predicted O-methyltransferase YrrM